MLLFKLMSKLTGHEKELHLYEYKKWNTYDKSLRFTFGNVHEMPGWSTWLSENFYYYCEFIR
jgi:hypothetical protein